MSELLKVKNLSVAIDDADILKNIDFTIGTGETHVLMGPNGAGKSTLGYTIMGNPEYVVKSGDIEFEGQSILEDGTDVRSKKGMFLSFQNPYEIAGLSLESFLRNAIRQITGKPLKIMQFKRDLKEAMEILQMDESYLTRDLNVGFSGGEKKKSEILQMLMLRPKLAILDETDSGLDVDAVRTVSHGIEAYQKNRDGALLIITHSTKILEALKVDYTHILVKGKLVETGDSTLVDEINSNGFARFENIGE
ncbi:FeS assembly ATPase SufC [Catonella morbi ATCC 51271]|uniref:FeS assembly ATPase SufC n=1 Tax=Catonella morbi ATCC 51271 TaxID=592026 RepID=V2Y5E1_9FIRM|nr:Fe-S cluster assembly ATPase SufC [Catonella morbi]ESL04148.1 FeS assembly ATPase SufC [Catonella morbi ATCC 51271]